MNIKMDRNLLLLPRRFNDLEIEAKFQESYKRAGLQFSKISLTIGLLATILFWLILAIFQFETQASFTRQILRLLIIGILFLAILNLIHRAEQVIKAYDLNLGLPVATCCLIVGSLGFIPLDSGEFSVNRFIAAMILVCWLTYGFTRLSVKLIAGVCGIASFLSFFSIVLHGDDHSVAILIYLIIANLVGWITAIQLERRERILFSRQLEILAEKNISDSNAKRAQAANQAKSRILAAVNHDLRQPLASLALYMQQLREQLSAGDSALLDTVDCLDACVTAISSDLDHLAEIGSEGQESSVPVVVVDLRTVLERVERVYARLARDSGVRLVIRMPDDGQCLVMSNESRLWDILSNLVSNALKFHSQDRVPWVLVRVRCSSGWWRLVVQDNGIGIPGEAHERIFEEYFRVTGAERARGNGQGLGLAIVREAAGRLDDHLIRFDSLPGRGTRFSLRMPAAAADAAVSEMGASGAVRAGDAGGDRGAAGPVTVLSGESAYPVLLVEDDEAMSRALARSLERWGYSVRRAATGEEAILLVEDAQDLLLAIISDFRLAGGWDGLRLIERLRVLEGQRTPALLLSGEFRVEALRNDAPDDVGILSKPPDISRLRAFLDGARQSQTF